MVSIIKINVQLINLLIQLFCIYIIYKIAFQASFVMQNSLKSLTNATQSNSLVLEKVMTYCDDLKTLK